jgi:ABC-type nitrate/sulfonate/bicarbonate transport system ATPase subunit
MIRVDNITFRYNKHLPLFRDFSWKVDVGQTWVIIGPSGCGKSTILYLLSGLQHPEHGEIRINGGKIFSPRPSTGLILQDFGLLPWATVKDNLTLGLNLRKFYGPDGKHAPSANSKVDNNSAVHSWLSRLGIADIADKFPGQISGGQRQRTAIARTLILEPDLLLMDEPFASLDTPTREDLEQLVRTISSERLLTTLLVTHTIEEALFLGEKILVLKNGVNSNPLILDNPFTGQHSPKHDEKHQSLVNRIREELKGKAE